MSTVPGDVRLSRHVADIDDTGHHSASGFTLTVKDEGGSLATGATSLDFVGSGVTASGTGAAKTITIVGAGQILIADTHSTPLVFADLIQTEAQDDLLYADT